METKPFKRGNNFVFTFLLKFIIPSIFGKLVVGVKEPTYIHTVCRYLALWSHEGLSAFSTMNSQLSGKRTEIFS
jgi:hypothetical protein